ncbi:MAG: alpha/beta fold hydrolase, partial [Solirubrobacterales bacterium]|nr:alpha/beta fold hydrolase [Solirubrobacterales bacterium]
MVLLRKVFPFFSAALVAVAVGPVSGASAQTPQIDWNACPEVGFPTLQCGTFKVPYDYNKPTGKKFTIAMQKLPASGKKIGALFTNPGGPGSEGLRTWKNAYISQSLGEAFDLIGFDPRGVGKTKPAFDCPSVPTPAPPNLPGVDWLKYAMKITPFQVKENRACQSKSADFISHVGTNDVVRDLDAMRAAVGDAKLTYWGMSYGTRIGYVYAYRYPKKVRAMILDGSVTPDGSWANFADIRSQSADDALRFIRAVSPASYAAVISTRNSLYASKLQLRPGLQMSAYHWLMFLTIRLMPFQPQWPKIIEYAGYVSKARIDGPDGAPARTELSRLIGVPNAIHAGGLGGGAAPAINCADYADRPTAAERARIVRNVVSKAPIFGGFQASGATSGCVGFTYRPNPVPKIASKSSLERVKDVKLVISDSTADGATPLVWGHAMAKAFPSASEVTMQGGQHVNFL